MEITQSQQTESQKKKKKQHRRPWDNIKWVNLCVIGIPEGEEKRGLKMYLKKLWLKTPKPKEGNRYPGTGSTEGPKQDEPKQTYTKTCYN